MQNVININIIYDAIVFSTLLFFSIVFSFVFCFFLFFNPRACARRDMWPVLLFLSFNPRACARRDFRDAVRIGRRTDFNPRARARRDAKERVSGGSLIISIHAPVRGATAGKTNIPHVICFPAHIYGVFQSARLCCGLHFAPGSIRRLVLSGLCADNSSYIFFHFHKDTFHSFRFSVFFCDTIPAQTDLSDDC